MDGLIVAMVSGEEKKKRLWWVSVLLREKGIGALDPLLYRQHHFPVVMGTQNQVL